EVRSDTKGVDDLNKRLGDTEKGADRAGASLGEMGDDAAKFRDEADRATVKLRDLQAQLLEFGDDRAIRGQIRATRAWRREMELAAQEFESTASGVGGDSDGIEVAIRRSVSKGTTDGF